MFSFILLWIQIENRLKHRKLFTLEYLLNHEIRVTLLSSDYYEYKEESVIYEEHLFIS